MKIYSNISSSSVVRIGCAILIYDVSRDQHSGCSKQSIATIHRVDELDGQATIGPGTPASRDSVIQLARGLMANLNMKLEMIPDKVLASGLNTIVWFCPPRREQLWFQPSAMAGKAEQFEALTKVSGSVFPNPGLVMVASPQGFQVFAVKECARPHARTRLYHAPYWNVGANGGMCVGSTRFPGTLSPSMLPQWEAAFFKSAFTHPLGGHKNSRTPPACLWPKLKGKRTFPSAELLPTKLTIQSFIRSHSTS